MPTEVIRIEGLAGVLDMLKSLPADIVSKNGGPVRTALRKGALLIQEQARDNIRRIIEEPNKGGIISESSGALEESVQIKRRKLPGGLKGERYWAGVVRLSGKKLAKLAARKNEPTSFYALFLEKGTERAVKHPFWVVAVEAKKDEFFKVFEEEIKKGLEKAVKKAEQQKRKD